MLKEYKTDQIRNVAIVGHGLTGKSTLLDALLFAGGKIAKIGSSDTGTLVSDYDDEEKKRKISIRSAMGFVELDGIKINILDTPGTADFVGETRAAIQAAELVIVVVDAVDGVQIETEKSWRYLNEIKKPRIIYVNKMDKERASFDTVLGLLRSSFKGNVAPVSYPCGEGEKFSGVVDLIQMKLVTPKGDGKDVAMADVPADMKDEAEDMRASLVELAAEGDDQLIEKFFEDGTLPDEDVRRGLGLQIAAAKLFPVLCGSSQKGVGARTLLQVIRDFGPAPFMGVTYTGHEPGLPDKSVTVTAKADGHFAAVVWKTYIDQYAGRFNYLKVLSGELLPDTDVMNGTRNDRERISKLYALMGNKQEEMPKLVTGDIGVVVKLAKTATGETLCDAKHPVVVSFLKLPHPVYSYAVDVPNKNEVDKVGQFFSRVTEENPTITYGYSAETAESVLSGMGEIQLGIILDMMKEKNKIEVVTREPRVAYRETVSKNAEAHFRHKKQSGGHGQFGEVFIRMSPLPRGKGFEFKESIFGGSIPKQYIPGVEKGLIDGLEEGVLGKFPVVDVLVDLYDGKYHDVDSSEMAFRIAARGAFKEGMEAAVPILLEPIMEVSIFVEKDVMGDILSDVTSRRGRVQGMGSTDDADGMIAVVKATIPLASMLRYSIDLRGMTSGKGTFEMSFSHYDPLTGKEADNVIAARKKHLEEEAGK